MAYDAVGVLGRGGNAVVELAYDAQGRPVATKRVAITGSAEDIRVARHRLRREAAILGRLRHPGIVPVLDVVDDGTDVVLVMPVMAENLADRVNRLGPLTPDEVTRIGRALLEALAAAHRYGVVHRDIKPANVLFDAAGRPALADFGVAVSSDLTGGLTGQGMVVGSPTWMAPEQAGGDVPGPAADVWSLAATLAYAVSGRPPRPHPGGGPGRTVDLGPVPPLLRPPLERMLHPDPALRPSAAAVLGGLDGTAVAPAAVVPGAVAPAAVAPGGVAPVGAGAPAVAAAGADGGRRPGRTTGGRPLGGATGAGWRRRMARVLDGPEPDRRRGRLRTALGVGAAVAVTTAVVAAVAVGLAASPSGSRTAGGRAASCLPLAYQPCGSAPAPHTDGASCDPGWYDLDGVAADGCEAHSDYVAGTALTADSPVTANLVPASATDTFTTHVSGDSLALCWGSLHVTLTAPPASAEQLTVWHGRSQVARAVSTDGTPATATVPKPSCLGGDAEDLTLTVSAVAGTGAATAADFTLTRDGGW